jgi:hypothetical protein
MSPGRLRKRLERLEHVLRAQTDAAALANRPQPQDSDEDLEHFQLMVYQLRSLARLTSEERAHFDRLSALHPHIANAKPMSDEEIDQLLKETAEEKLKEIAAAERSRRKHAT